MENYHFVLCCVQQNFVHADKQGSRSHRIIGGHKRRLGVWIPQQRGPGAEPR